MNVYGVCICHVGQPIQHTGTFDSIYQFENVNNIFL